MKKSTIHYHSISDIVAAVYCEQKLVFDRELGDASPEHIRMRAEEGIIEHRRFEREGQIRVLLDKPGKTIDKRCFVASCLYGIDAPETIVLRKWRDDKLLQSGTGRWLVRSYYRISPRLVTLIDRHGWLVRPIRLLLDWIVRLIRKSPVLIVNADHERYH